MHRRGGSTATTLSARAAFQSADTAGAIYLVGNPLDIAISFAAFRGQPIDVTIREDGRLRVPRLGARRCLLGFRILD
jgi:hypothetical protein